MKLIVGLGNPGPQYEHTRHNVGAMVVRRVAQQQGLAWQERPHAWMASWRAPEARLLVPSIMMNQSGEALAEAADMPVAMEEILIVCDDVNLPLGTLRLRPEGSDGGHHGLASCLQRLGTEDVPRLRVGVGVPSLPKELTEFVLSPFEPQEHSLVEDALARAAEACELWATGGIEVAMSRVNVRRQAGE